MNQRSINGPYLVLWVIWTAMLGAVVVYQFVLGGGLPKGVDPDQPLNPVFLAMGVVPVGAAALIRWFLLPRARHFGQVLTLLIVGVCLAEVTEFVGLFLVGRRFPETQAAFFLLSLLGVGQFLPSLLPRKPMAVRPPGPPKFPAA